MRLVKLGNIYFNPDQIKRVTPHPTNSTKCHVDGYVVDVSITQVLIDLSCESQQDYRFLNDSQRQAWGEIYHLCLKLKMPRSDNQSSLDAVLAFIKRLHESNEAFEGIKAALEEARDYL